MSWLDFIPDAVTNLFSSAGSSVPTSVEPDVLGSAAQTASNVGDAVPSAIGDLGASGAPAAISAANPATFLDAAGAVGSGAPAFNPASTGGPPPVTPGDVATNPALGQLSGGSGNAAAQGGIAPTLTGAPTAPQGPPAPPSATTPGTEASAKPGGWWSTMANNAATQVQKNPWQALGVGAGLVGSALAMGQGQPSAGKMPNMPGPGPTSPAPTTRPLSTATGVSPILRQGAMNVQNPWAGLGRK